MCECNNQTIEGLMSFLGAGDNAQKNGMVLFSSRVEINDFFDTFGAGAASESQEVPVTTARSEEQFDCSETSQYLLEEPQVEEQREPPVPVEVSVTLLSSCILT